MYLNPVTVQDQTYYEGKCRCHAYRISPKILGRVGDSYDKPVDYCNRLVGFRPIEWTDFFVSWFEELQLVQRQNTKIVEENLQ